MSLTGGCRCRFSCWWGLFALSTWTVYTFAPREGNIHKFLFVFRSWSALFRLLCLLPDKHRLSWVLCLLLPCLFLPIMISCSLGVQTDQHHVLHLWSLFQPLWTLVLLSSSRHRPSNTQDQFYLYHLHLWSEFILRHKWSNTQYLWQTFIKPLSTYWPETQTDQPTYIMRFWTACHHLLHLWRDTHIQTHSPWLGTTLT